MVEGVLNAVRQHTHRRPAEYIVLSFTFELAPELAPELFLRFHLGSCGVARVQYDMLREGAEMSVQVEKLTDEMITELDKGQDAPAAGA